jgi:hypothetical protein
MNSKFGFLARKPRKFLGLERVTIAEWQGASKICCEADAVKNQILNSFVCMDKNPL